MISVFAEAWAWVTQLANSKMLALMIFFPLFVLIVLYVYTGKQRSERLESYKYMPFQDEPPETEQDQGKPK